MMIYESMPLYPALRPGCNRETCVKVPVFEGDACGRPGPALDCRRVSIENPCCPGECAEVTLGVDACGNLLVCVRRDPPPCRHDRPPCRPCRPREDRCLPPPPRCGCERGRLYGSWR